MLEVQEDVPAALKSRRWREVVVEGRIYAVPAGVHRVLQGWRARHHEGGGSQYFRDSLDGVEGALRRAMEFLAGAAGAVGGAGGSPMAETLTVPRAARRDARYIRRAPRAWRVVVPFTSPVYIADSRHGSDPERSYAEAVRIRDAFLADLKALGIALGRRRLRAAVDKPANEIGISPRYDESGQLKALEAVYSPALDARKRKVFALSRYGHSKAAALRAAQRWRQEGIERAAQENPIDLRAPRSWARRDSPQE